MVTVACHDASGASCTPHTAMAAMLLGLLLAIAGRRPVSAAEGNAAGLAASKAQDLFPTRNDTLFVEDLESSRIARTFAENVALPIKSMVPRSYSAQFVRAQMSMTGFFQPSDLGPEERILVRDSLAKAINRILERSERCCSNAKDISITTVCFYDYTGCISMVLKSRPQDCGDGRAIDPEGCDDGNTEDGDGCSSECTVEKGFYCVGGNRFAADQCRNLNQSLYFRRKDRRGPSWLGEDADLEMPDGSLYLGPHSEQGAEPPSSERDPQISNANSRQDGNHTRRQYAGSIVVSINVEFNPATSDEGNNTMYIRHLHQSLMHPDFLRRFQEAMREQDTPVVVAWTEKGQPILDVYSGSPRQFYSEFMDGRDMMKCLDNAFSHEDGSACAYLDYVAGMTLFGLSLSGIVIMSCTVFCCARMFPCCYWIGIPCKVGRKCGGDLPTKRRKQPEVLRAVFYCILGSCGVLGMTVVGYRCTQQVLFDIGRAIYAIEAAQKAPAIFRASVSNSTTLLKVTAAQTLSEINNRLTGLPLLKEITVQANSSLQETVSRIADVQKFIEGDRNVSGSSNISMRNPCTFLDDLTDLPLSYDTDLMVWKMSNGEESPTLSPEGFHDFVDGRPSILPNGRQAPTCSLHSFFSYVYSSEHLSCPCCRDCFVYDAAITQTLAGMPTMADLENLNTPVPYEMVGDDIDALMKEMDKSIQLVDEWMVSINIGLDGIKFALRTIVNFMPGIYAWTWGTSWLAVLLVGNGMIRDNYRMIYGAYCLGVFACATCLFPIVGLGAMAVIPMSDFCNGIPVTGADTSNFLKTFTTTGDIMQVNRSILSILTDCFTKPDGVLWNVVDLDRPLLINRLQRYDLSKKIDPAFFERGLNTERRDLTTPFTNHYDALSRMTSDNKIYGYDSMPYATRPTSEQYLNLHGNKRMYTFQRGGVIQGTSTSAIIRQVNTILSSAMNEAQLLRACNLRVDSVPAQNVWQSLGGKGKITDACLTDNKEMYSDYLGAREPSQIVFDYNIYKDELQRRIAEMQRTADEAEYHLANIKRLSALLESNLTLMTGDAVAAINLIAEELITIGSCREFNKLYENVRTPMCENLSVSMDAFWIACFLAGMAWIPYFWVLLRNGKIVMLKKGLGERMHIKKVKKGGGTDKIAPAPAGGDLRNQV